MWNSGSGVVVWIPYHTRDVPKWREWIEVLRGLAGMDPASNVSRWKVQSRRQGRV